MSDINKSDDVRREFLRKFSGPNGYCLRCGEKPKDGPTMQRALWYATHRCDEGRSKGGLGEA